MTRDRFDNTSFSNGMRIQTNMGERLPIIVVDFEEKMIGVKGDSKYQPVKWYHCEGCEIVTEKRPL
jgi:aromatic ring-cleaving dioxygenase